MIAILGGGLAGIQAGLALQKAGVPFRVLEREDAIGGLLRPGRRLGWTYDLGVKALYSVNQKVMDYLKSLPVAYCEHRRRVTVHHRDPATGSSCELDYPFENGLGGLPHEAKVACLMGYIEAQQGSREVKNFLDWIMRRLGRGIAEAFMLPYNRKIWNAPLEEISPNLVAQKIHPAPLEEIVRSCLGERIVGRKYQARFIYPTHGLPALLEAMASPIAANITTRFSLTRIEDTGDGFRLHGACGRVVTCRAVISTIPLPALRRAVPYDDCPAADWPHNNTVFHAVLLKNASGPDVHWQFFASPEIPFYRLTYSHAFSPALKPAIVAEMTERPGAAYRPEDTVRWLNTIGIARPDNVESVQTHRLECTYPIPTLRSEAELPGVVEFLEARNIFPLGRSGSWRYLNIDGVIAQVCEKTPDILRRAPL
ncbi:MAG TPA: FAD-dependent oxidoreductase [Candidatus Brocadiia bacterium]|nr:FAD-dependent oxidoreductase [Candidatus Brocadiia bacterium]